LKESDPDQLLDDTNQAELMGMVEQQMAQWEGND